MQTPAYPSQPPRFPIAAVEPQLPPCRLPTAVFLAEACGERFAYGAVLYDSNTMVVTGEKFAAVLSPGCGTEVQTGGVPSLIRSFR